MKKVDRATFNTTTTNKMLSFKKIPPFSFIAQGVSHLQIGKRKQSMIISQNFIHSKPPTFNEENDIRSFLSTLKFTPLSERQEFLKWSDNFPLVIQRPAVELAVETWLSRLQPDVVPTKENQPLLMTSAPTGSGKTFFLQLLCQLFRHQWDIDKFMYSLHIDKSNSSPKNSISSSKAIWLDAMRQTVESIKKSERIEKLIASGELSQSFLTSTHPCFVSFNSTSPITALERKLLGNSPEHMLLARIIFAELQPESPTSPLSSTSWTINYDGFLSHHGRTLLQLPPSLDHVVDFIRKKSGCTHFLLAVDELLQLDGKPEPMLNQRVETVLDDVKVSEKSESSNLDSRVNPSFTPGVRRVMRTVGQTVITDPKCAAIISSLVTGPLDEYVCGSQHEPVFIPLHPLIDNLAALGDIIVQRRNRPESLPPVMRMLLSTGGHPKLLFQIIPWLSNPALPCDEMTLARAAEKCCIKKIGLHRPEIVQAILVGTPASSDVVAFTCGLGGMLTRPTSVDQPSIIIASPLLLYAVASSYVRNHSKGLKLDVLVPSEIASGEDFERFVATWLTLRLRMGHSLAELLDDQNGEGGDEILCESLKVRRTERIHSFADWGAFVEALPSTDGAKVFLEMAQRAVAKGEPRLFGMSGDSSIMRVSIPFAKRNPGFDILVGRCDKEKRVLLIQCKTQESDTAENDGKGQTITAKDLDKTVRRSLENVQDLIREGWTVSLVVIAACQTSSTVVTECRTLKSPHEADHIINRTGVIAKAALRDLFGASFGLALELAQGHQYQRKK